MGYLNFICFENAQCLHTLNPSPPPLSFSPRPPRVRYSDQSKIRRTNTDSKAAAQSACCSRSTQLSSPRSSVDSAISEARRRRRRSRPCFRHRVQLLRKVFVAKLVQVVVLVEVEVVVVVNYSYNQVSGRCPEDPAAK